MLPVRLTHLSCALVILAATAGSGFAAAPGGTPPALDARAAILVEALTGAVLYENGADPRGPFAFRLPRRDSHNQSPFYTHLIAMQ